MDEEEELYELPEWVKLVNRVLKGENTLEDESPNSDESSNYKDIEA